MRKLQRITNAVSNRHGVMWRRVNGRTRVKREEGISAQMTGSSWVVSLTFEWGREEWERDSQGEVGKTIFLAEATTCAKAWRCERMRWIWLAKCLVGCNVVNKEKSDKSWSQRSWPVMWVLETIVMNRIFIVHAARNHWKVSQVCVCVWTFWKVPLAAL